MHLTKDIYSLFNPSHCYGKKDEQVKIISEYAGLACVEGSTGRFHVHNHELASEPVKDETAQPEQVQQLDAVASHFSTPIKKQAPKKVSKPSINNQQTLF